MLAADFSEVFAADGSITVEVPQGEGGAPTQGFSTPKTRRTPSYRGSPYSSAATSPATTSPSHSASPSASPYSRATASPSSHSIDGIPPVPAIAPSKVSDAVVLASTYIGYVTNWLSNWSIPRVSIPYLCLRLASDLPATLETFLSVLATKVATLKKDGTTQRLHTSKTWQVRKAQAALNEEEWIVLEHLLKKVSEQDPSGLVVARVRAGNNKMVLWQQVPNVTRGIAEQGPRRQQQLAATVKGAQSLVSSPMDVDESPFDEVCLDLNMEQVRNNAQKINPLLPQRTTYVWKEGDTLEFMHHVNITWSQKRLANTFLRAKGLKFFEGESKM
jgi:hypothetical protein